VNIVIATGSSGGHLLPAISFAKVFENQTRSRISFLLSQPKSWEVPHELKPYDIFWVGSFPLPRRIDLSLLAFPFRLIANSIRIFKWIHQQKPDCVVGFGSFVSVPALLSAKLLGIPTLLHEQNFSFGKANKLISPLVDQVATSFPPRASETNGRVVLTGNLLRKSVIEKARESSYVSLQEGDKLNILVVGGSQGSFFINSHFRQALEELTTDELGKIRVRHITGRAHHLEVAEQYRKLPEVLEAEVVPFDAHIEESYGWSHWVIARSGAGVLFELMALERPSLLIPYPGAESHQVENARYFESKGACWDMEESEVSVAVLHKKISSLIVDPSPLMQLTKQARKCKILDGAERLSQVAQKIMRPNEN